MNTAAKVNELNEAELPAVELLRRLGYTYVPRDLLAPERDNEREVLLKERLRNALLRLNPWMKPDHTERVIFNLENVEAVGMARNQAVHELLIYGMPLDVEEASGRRTRTVRFFDFDHPEPKTGLNEFVVTTQLRVRRGNERMGKIEDDEKVVKPDLVLFANGLPLVVMEAKSPTLFDVWKTQAVKQLLRYQEAGPEWHRCGAPELFDYNLMCVVHCGASAAYAAVGAHENEYVEWKSIAPYEADDARDRFGVEPKGQAELIIGLLAPATLLDVLRDFVVFEPERGRLIKKLPRYQQYRTVTKATSRVLTEKEAEERGGVVWHTQGSGKSLTMLWLATKLRREPRLQNPTMVIVTDRTQLDRQITDTFRRSGFPAPERAETTKDLRRLLTVGAGRTIMTTIQKFGEALQTPDGAVETLNDADNLFVMVDEAHRTQYGLLAAKMRKALKNAVFIGFTGTPIDKGFRKNTVGKFGPLIDTYRIKESVEDRVTVPIYYEARLPELAIIGPNTLDRLFDTLFADMAPEDRERIRRRYANKQTLAEAERRIEMIAEDIARHYKERIKPNGFKAQVVAPSRQAAMRYAENLRDFQVSAYPIITTTNDDGAEYKWAKEINQDQIVGMFKDPDGEPEVLVVVDMLLTGFDAPVEQVLYLDREMREHGLLQAIARVNRRCTLTRPDGVTTEKAYGLVVDYYGVSRDLASALSDFDPGDIQGTWTELEDDPASVIDAAADRAEHYFAGKDLDDTWACVEVFVDETAEDGFKADLFEKFNADYLDFSQLMDRFLPDARALAYAPRLTRLTRIRAYVRAQFLRFDGNIDWSDVAAKVKDLIDSRINAEVRELMKPVSILDQNFEEKISVLPHDEARASVMEHAIRAQIKERIDENPVLYERLSQQLERIIAEMRHKLIDAAEAVRRLRVLRDSMQAEADVAVAHGLSEVSLAVYELLERSTTAEPSEGASVREEQQPYRVSFDERLKDVALRVEEVMKHGQGIVDWQSKDDVQRMMRRDIKRELRKIGSLSEDEIDELARRMVDVARRKMA